MRECLDNHPIDILLDLRAALRGRLGAGAGGNQYEVIAGSARFAALTLLAKQGWIDKGSLIPCNLVPVATTIQKIPLPNTRNARPCTRPRRFWHTVSLSHDGMTFESIPRAVRSVLRTRAPAAEACASAPCILTNSVTTPSASIRRKRWQSATTTPHRKRVGQGCGDRCVEAAQCSQGINEREQNAKASPHLQWLDQAYEYAHRCGKWHA